MQNGDPSWSGYIYAFSIFAGVVWIIFVSCMLCIAFVCCFSVFELPSNNCDPSDSKLSNPFTSIFSHWEFLLRHSTFRMLCVSVSGWGPHWYVFLAYQELYFPSIKRLCNQQASMESLVPFLRSLFYLWTLWLPWGLQVLICQIISKLDKQNSLNR